MQNCITEQLILRLYKFPLSVSLLFIKLDIYKIEMFSLMVNHSAKFKKITLKFVKLIRASFQHQLSQKSDQRNYQNKVQNFVPNILNFGRKRFCLFISSAFFYLKFIKTYFICTVTQGQSFCKIIQYLGMSLFMSYILVRNVNQN